MPQNRLSPGPVHLTSKLVEEVFAEVRGQPQATVVGFSPPYKFPHQDLAQDPVREARAAGACENENVTSPTGPTA
jgi:hypothetical protein